ncbi:MAG: energy transducer TonB [Xanthomonadales bacterium]|nr:MotA/TolQ/ExbB proton channel family protein [Gammaproteobacteria bacterium]MBT8054814.1 MotA/TolQ/ExbB proton channel family protein [Gammaproteobacteria bacterium]NND58495.1 energy transducer TonB [Xanthomonadales bacterium]NNK51079.1 energy transducer TonB [Xanthomonadales bacterium]
MINKIFKAAVIAGLVFGLGNTAYAAQAVSLDELLQQVKSGRVKDAAENQKRIADFQSARGEQQRLLRQMEAEQTRQEGISQQLEDTFEANDAQIIDLERALQERLGELKELFGVLQQAAGDARGNFDTSVTQIQFPNRGQWLTEFAQKMGSTTRMPTLEEIERIWFELQREMTESARVVKLNTTVINADGEEEQRDVVRVGLFNVISDGKYLEYVPETGRLVELQRQPASRYTGRADDLQDASDGVNSFAVDPTRGQLLALLVQSPSLMERIAQGKQVGYVIIALGIVGLLIALWRLFALWTTSVKVVNQTKHLDKAGNNPLGRVLKIAIDNPQSDVESLELKLGEAILKETPKFNSMLSFLKIISVVAPLLGLLGTVTGMIITFQAITLYGAGDPKLMAGGISTALVTTVLGLVVAIPTVFLHTLVQSRAKRLTQILQEEAAGMLSERAERTA